MSTEQNKSIVRRWIEEGWNKHNLNLIDELYAPDCVQIDPNSPVPVRSAAELKQFCAVYLRAFEDLHFSIDDLTAEADRVVWRWTATATHTGPLLDLPPTGKRVNVTGQVQFNLKDSRIQTVWVNLDFYGMLAGMGVIPTPQH